MELTISRRDLDDATVLTLVGSIDLVSKQKLVSAGKQVLGAGSDLRLDMAGVDFMDSMGIGALVELARHAQILGQRFRIDEKSPRVSRVLRVMGLDDVWGSA